MSTTIKATENIYLNVLRLSLANVQKQIKQAPACIAPVEFASLTTLRAQLQDAVAKAELGPVPDGASPVYIAVIEEGGIVQTVHSTSPATKVEVFSFDDDDSPAEARNREAKRDAYFSAHDFHEIY